MNEDSVLESEGPCPVHDLGYGTESDPFRAVLVLTDPLDWGRDLQIITDVVSTHGVPESRRLDISRPVVKVFIGSGDLLWANDFPSPRFGLGAFSIAFQSLYKSLKGNLPQIVHYGKPTVLPFRSVPTRRMETTVFRWAEKLLTEQAKQLGKDALDTIFMVGDNPAADVRGARNAGSPWKSVLVHTGVYASENTENDDPADIEIPNVVQFIEKAI